MSIRQARRAMSDAVAAARRDLGALRADRPSPHLLAGISVSAWGGTHQLEHVAQVQVRGARTLVVAPHDPSLVPGVEKALRDAGLGGSASVEGPRIAYDLPAPDDTTRAARQRQARERAEEGRIAIRLARQDEVKRLRRAAAAGELVDRQVRGRDKVLQEAVDEHVAEVDELLAEVLGSLES